MTDQSQTLRTAKQSVNALLFVTTFILIGLRLFVPTPVAAANNVTAAVNLIGGVLSASIEEFNGIVTVSVIDARGTGAGWNITISCDGGIHQVRPHSTVSKTSSSIDPAIGPTVKFKAHAAQFVQIIAPPRSGMGSYVLDLIPASTGPCTATIVFGP